MKTIEEVVQNMPGAKVFSKYVATSGYWQLKLDEERCARSTLHLDSLRVPSQQAKYFSK